MRGILSAAGYVPYRRLARADIAAFMGSGGGKGSRAVASHDEDTTTLGVEAARLALRGASGAEPEALWFATSRPAYLDKTNATAVAAALRQPADIGAYDFGGALRSGIGSLVSALRGGGTTLVVAADVRDGLPTSGDESAGGDAGAAVLVGDGPQVLAELVSGRPPPPTSSPIAGARTGDRRVEALGGALRREPLPGPRPGGARPGPGSRRTGDERDRAAGRDRHARARRSRPDQEAGTRPRGSWSTTWRSAWGRPARPIRCSSSPRPSSRWPVVQPRRARPSSCCTWPTAPTPWSSAPPRRWRAGTPPAPSQARWPTAHRSATPSSCPGGAMLQPEPPRRPEPARVSSTAAWTQRGLEVRLRRVQGPQLRCGPPATLAGVHGGWGRRRHGAGRQGRRRGHRGDLHHRPPGLLPQPADRVRHRSTSTAAGATRSS